MRRIILTLICASMTLSILAGTPRLTRSQLKQATAIKDQSVKPSQVAGRDKSLSLQQVLKERHLTLDDNKLNSKATSGDLIRMGDYIASFDLYDFDWDDDNAIATVIDSTGAMMGKNCRLERNFGELTNWYIKSFYGDYSIPIKVNALTGTVTISAGVELDHLTTTVESEVARGTVVYELLWTIYAMPLSWLEGDSVYHDIKGVILDDGTIEFNDDFGFLVEERIKYSNGGLSETISWSLSPIFENLILYEPNAIHNYDTDAFAVAIEDYMVIVNNGTYYPMGSGGSVPKPIKPRPTTISNTGTAKPITPRNFRPSFGTMLPDQDSDDSQETRCENTDLRLDFNPTVLHGSQPIYMYQLDDTTFMVYNLFGKDYCWNYMNIAPDGSVFIPAQPVGASSQGTVFYNCSGSHVVADTLVWGNQGTRTQNCITWGKTYFCSESNNSEGLYSINRKYWNTVIVFGSDGAVVGVLTEPENITVQPKSTTACVAWQDTLNTSWNLRYRPWLDPSTLAFLCNMNGSYDDVLVDFDQNWLLLDEDGDGQSWNIAMVSNGDYCFMSESWASGMGDFTPDNWLISPEVDLQGGLRFTVWGNEMYPDKLMLYVCIGEPETTDDFIALTYKDIVMTSEKKEYTFNLGAYAGQKGHIAFRHYNSDGMEAVFLDDIFIAETPLNEWMWVYGLSATDCTILNLTPETTYEVQIQAIEQNVLTSNWTGPVVFTTWPDIQPGDVNGDGQVKINDVSALISYLLSDSTTEINLIAADCNHDGAIKINDVNLLVNYLLSGSW